MKSQGKPALPSEAPDGTDTPEAGASSAIEDLLSRVDAPEAELESSKQPAAAPFAGLRTAQMLRQERRSATIRWRGSHDDVAASIAADVDVELVKLAVQNGDSVLVECMPGLAPVIVGILQTKIPRELVLKADSVRIEGQREITLVSGRAAMRMRKDGDLELVATRISAASRGFFKLVGLMLRLN